MLELIWHRSCMHSGATTHLELKLSACNFGVVKDHNVAAWIAPAEGHAVQQLQLLQLHRSHIATPIACGREFAQSNGGVQSQPQEDRQEHGAWIDIA